MRQRARSEGGERSPAEAAEQALAALDAAAALNAVVHRDDERVRARARRLERVREREGGGALFGLPLVVKDNIATRRMPTGCASRMLEGYVAPEPASTVSRLEAAGALVVGKSNCDEFGMGSSTETSCNGPTLHPRDPARVPGGSSGGSAAAVAAGVVELALGSDTGGSVRQPAAFCGVYGLRPTRGRVSRHGLVAFASSMDQVGLIARRLDLLEAALDAIEGADGLDALAIDAPPAGRLDAPRPPLSALRVGIARGALEGEGVDEEGARALEAARRALDRAGAQVALVDTPSPEDALAAYHLLAPSEAASNLARYDGVRCGRRRGNAGELEALYLRSRSEGFGAEVRRRILLGNALAADERAARLLARARAFRTRLGREYAALFERCDLLVDAATPGPAFRLGEHLGDPLAMYQSDRFMAGASLAGLPALALPAPSAGGALPRAVQAIGPAFAEAQLLVLARALAGDGFTPEAA